MSSIDEIRENNKKALREFNNVKDLKYPSLELPFFIKADELAMSSKWREKNNKLNFGDHILYQIVYTEKSTDKKNFMTYPMMALFTAYNIADQALEYEFVHPLRTWQYKFEPSIGYYTPATEVQSHIDWFSYIYIFGVWKSAPTWQEMKKAYRNTFYFREDRKTKISRILNTK
ncbi:MAG: hypothetical protein RLZZ546_1738 [Bacteroidota bacterium]|jgi:hypothetical protein